MACFPRLSLLVIFLVLFCFLGLPFVVFQPESWGFSHLIMTPLLLLLCSQSSDTCRRASVRGRRSLPHLLGTTAPLVGETHPPLRDLGPEAFLLLLPLWACVEAGTLRRSREKRQGFLYSAWVLAVPSPTPGARTRKLLLEPSLYLGTSSWVLGCPEIHLGHIGGKKG